jgi:hypothetical protein
LYLLQPSSKTCSLNAVHISASDKSAAIKVALDGICILMPLPPLVFHQRVSGRCVGYYRGAKFHANRVSRLKPSLTPTKQLRQLGEVARHPSSLVHGQHLSDARVVVILAGIEISE